MVPEVSGNNKDCCFAEQTGRSRSIVSPEERTGGAQPSGPGTL
jgi:hypothetical protein